MLEYDGEDLSCFKQHVPIENIRKVTIDVIEDFIDHEMSKGNRQ